MGHPVHQSRVESEKQILTTLSEWTLMLLHLQDLYRNISETQHDLSI